MDLVKETAPVLGIVLACAVLGLSRATFYRRLAPKKLREWKTPARALSPVERKDVLALLHEPRFADLAPGEIYATLLDEEKYVCGPDPIWWTVDLSLSTSSS